MYIILQGTHLAMNRIRYALKQIRGELRSCGDDTCSFALSKLFGGFLGLVWCHSLTQRTEIENLTDNLGGSSYPVPLIDKNIISC